MITGYFCIDKTDFRWRGIVDIYCTTLFYSVAFLLLAFILDKEVTKRTLLLSIMPIRQELYWFVSSYIGLMMVAPFFARFASLINKRQYKILLGTLFVISFEYLYGCLYAGFKSILFFSFLFFVAGYINFYGISKKWRNNKGMVVLIIWIAYFVIATCINLVFCEKAQFVLIYFVNNGLTLFLSIAVFVYFANTDIKGNRLAVLCKISPYVFGVYLFHDNPFFRKDLWHILIPNQYHIPIVLHCFVVLIAIFFAGILVDYFRQVVFRWIHIDKIEEWLVKRMPVMG